MSCVLEDWHLAITNTEHEGQFDEAYLDTFLDDLKTFFVGGFVFPRLHMSQR